MRHSKSRAASRLTKQLNESTTTAIYTLSLHDALPISVIIQATVIGFIPVINFGLNNESHALLAAILGGLLIGVGVGGALKYGTSTGGFDIIAQYWSIKKGSSVGFISMVLNVLIAFAGALITRS